MDAFEDDPWGEEPAWARDDGEEQQSEETEILSGFGAQHILILIDCRPSMFVPCIPIASESDSSEKENGDQEELEQISAFDAALMACEKVLRLRVRYVATSKAGKRDGVGILLYGTKQRPVVTPQDTDLEEEEGKRVNNDERSESDDSDDEEDKTSSGPPLSSTHTFLPIKPPGIEEIRSVRSCLPDRDRGLPRKRDLGKDYAETNKESQPSNVAQRMGHMTLCPLRSALHEAGKAFLNAKSVKKLAATSKIPADVKTVWIFTNEDNPCDGNKDEEKLLGIVAKDAVENGLTIEVWPLPRLDGAAFSREVFFDRIITSRDQQNGGDEERDAFDLEEMLDNVLRQWKKVRTVATLPLLLPDWRDRPEDPGIMVDLYGIVQIQRKPQSVSIHQQSNRMTEKTSQVITKDTGEVIYDGKKKTVARSSQPPPSDDTVDRIRTFASLGDNRVPLTRDELTLIKKQSNAADKASLILLGFKRNDAIPVAHLIDRCFLVYPNDDRVKGSKTAFANLRAAMIQKHVIATGELLQRATATSRLVALYPQHEEGSEKQLASPGMILVHLPFEDDIRALEEDLGDTAPKETVDAAMELVQSQNLDGIEFGYSFENASLSRFWEYIESVAIDTPLKTEEDETDVDYESVKQVAGQQIETFRRLLPEELIGAKSRKRKIGVGEECNWFDLYRANSLSACTVDLLKKYLKENGLAVSGKKNDLIERVAKHLEETLAEGGAGKLHVKEEAT